MSMANRLMLAAFGFALTVAYCPVIAGGASTPRWLVAIAIVPVVLIWLLLIGRKMRTTITHLLGAVFLAWAVLSLLWTETPYDSIDAAWKLALLGGCFALGSLIEDATPIWIGAAAGIALSSALVLIEFAGGPPIPETTPYAGLFANRNYLTEAAVLVLIGLVIQRKSLGMIFWPMVMAVLPAIALAHSRGALVGLAVGLGWMAATKWWWRAILIGGILTASSMVAFTFLIPGHNLAAVADRFDIWGDAMHGLTIWGHGIGSFGSTLPLYAVFTDSAAIRNEFAHNDFLQILYELGVPGLILAIGFVWITLQSSGSERYVFAAFIVESFFAFPLHLPTTAVLGAFMAGRAAHSLPMLRLETIVGRVLFIERYDHSAGGKGRN